MDTLAKPATFRLGNLRPQLPIGLVLIGISWPLAWSHAGVLSEYTFFPLWLGYILTMDGLVALRGRASLLTRAPGHWVALFLTSAPVWWIFEGLNNFTQNWHYTIRPEYSVLQIILEATIDFSIVLPAVFETAELVGSFSFIRQLADRPRLRFRALSDRRVLWLAMYVGAGMLLALILWPRYAFPFVWVWGFLLIDPLNALRGRPSLFAQVARGDWRTVASLGVAVLICGFFWEMWNYNSWPKWFYTVPFFGFWKVFEMPLLGYLGYLPFAGELYALYQYLWGFLKLGPTEAVIETSNVKRQM